MKGGRKKEEDEERESEEKKLYVVCCCGGEKGEFQWKWEKVYHELNIVKHPEYSTNFLFYFICSKALGHSCWIELRAVELRRVKIQVFFVWKKSSKWNRTNNCSSLSDYFADICLEASSTHRHELSNLLFPRPTLSSSSFFHLTPTASIPSSSQQKRPASIGRQKTLKAVMSPFVPLSSAFSQFVFITLHQKKINFFPVLFLSLTSLPISHTHL